MKSLSPLSAVTCSIQKPPPEEFFHNHISPLSSSFKPLLKDQKQAPLRFDVPKFIRSASLHLLDAFVDSAFKFIERPWLNQGNFASVDEIGEAIPLSIIEGEVPRNFPQGVYLRNGPNYLHPKETATVSMFGKTAFTWVEGEGMLHATYFNKDSEGKWMISYRNRYVETETFRMEKQRKKSLFIPLGDGHPTATLVAFALNLMRLGKLTKDITNTAVFAHGGRAYSVAENYLPYEIDVSNLDTLRIWDVNGAWDRAFTAHPKRAPETGHMVVMGVDAKKPFYVLGVISVDGNTMLHKVDLNFKERNFIHELGVTKNYNIIMDYPLRFGLDILLTSNQFFGYDKNGKSRIGVMPRFGDANSVTWFDVKKHCSLHIINSFEDGDEIIVRGCRTSRSVIPGPDYTIDKGQWYQRAFLPPNEGIEGFDPDIDGVLFSRIYQWRVNMRTGAVKEGYLTGNEIAMDFPTINDRFTGYKNKYAYMQVVDSVASSKIGIPKFKMLAKLFFDHKDKENKELIKVEYHVLEGEHYCSGVQFVEKGEGFDEDDGWVVCYIHDEKANISKVYIIDAKKFTKVPVAKIILPQRVPYGFHGIFLCINYLIVKTMGKHKWNIRYTLQATYKELYNLAMNKEASVAFMRILIDGVNT